MRRLAIGRRTKLISERRHHWRRSRRQWFSMDMLEIVVPGVSGEAVISQLPEKMAFTHQNG